MSDELRRILRLAMSDRIADMRRRLAQVRRDGEKVRRIVADVKAATRRDRVRLLRRLAGQ